MDHPALTKPGVLASYIERDLRPPSEALVEKEGVEVGGKNCEVTKSQSLHYCSLVTSRTINGYGHVKALLGSENS